MLHPTHIFFAKNLPARYLNDNDKFMRKDLPKVQMFLLLDATVDSSLLLIDLLLYLCHTGSFISSRT